jgi:hypothetical protein
MLKQFLFLAVLVLSSLAPRFAAAQCTSGTSSGTITPTATWQQISMNGNRYVTFTAVAGIVYQFSFCTADGGSSIHDTQLTLTDNNATPNFLAYNDDFCGLSSYVTWTCPLAGTYRIYTHKFPCSNQNNLGNLSYRTALPLSCPNNLGGGAITVPSLPYSISNTTTCGFGNDFTAANMIACGSNLYLGGEDRVWIFTPGATGNITINLQSTGAWNGLMLYQGCPLLGQGGTCVDVSQSSAGNQSITACVTQNQTYYLVLDVWPAPQCNPITSLSISAPVPVGGCTLGPGTTNIGLPYSASGRTTCGKGNDLTANNTISCGNDL